MADQHYLFDILIDLTNEKRRHSSPPIRLTKKKDICHPPFVSPHHKPNSFNRSLFFFMYFQVAKWEWRFSDISSLHMTSLLFSMAGLITKTKRLQLKKFPVENLVKVTTGCLKTKRPPRVERQDPQKA